jgi:hypothetical protein
MSLWLALTPSVSHARGCAALPDVRVTNRCTGDPNRPSAGSSSWAMIKSAKSAKSADDFS